MKKDEGTNWPIYITVLLLAIAFISWMVMLCWNIGVVGIADACGAEVADIGYFTAMFSYLLIRIVVNAGRVLTTSNNDL